MDVHRNDPCPCGSELRYKHCCGRLATRPLDARAQLRQRMLAALEHQRAGRWRDAERLYRAVLAEAPAEPDALHMLGVICLQTGRTWEAFARIRRALDLTDWAVPMMQHNLALVLPNDGLVPVADLAFLMPPSEDGQEVGETAAWRSSPAGSRCACWK